MADSNNSPTDDEEAFDERRVSLKRLSKDPKYRTLTYWIEHTSVATAIAVLFTVGGWVYPWAKNPEKEYIQLPPKTEYVSVPGETKIITLPPEIVTVQVPAPQRHLTAAQELGEGPHHH